MSECERGLARPWSWTVYRIKLTFERDCGLSLAGAERGAGRRRVACFVGVGNGVVQRRLGGFRSNVSCHPVSKYKGAIPTHFLTQQTVHFFSRKTKFFV